MAAVMEEKIFRGLREVALLGFLTLAVYLTIALLTFSNEDAGWTHSGTGQDIQNACGMVGAWIADFLLSLFGLMAYIFPALIVYWGWLFFRQGTLINNSWYGILRISGFFATLITGTALLYLHVLRTRIPLPATSGGILGEETGDALVFLFGNSGATLLLLAVFFAGVTLFANLSWVMLIDQVGKYSLLAGQKMFCIFARPVTEPTKQATSEDYVMPPAAEISRETEKPTPSSGKRKMLKREAGTKKRNVRIEPAIKPIEKTERAAKKKSGTAELLPPLSLLDEIGSNIDGYSREALEEMSRLVEEVLQDFGVSVEVVAVHPGPVVTRFELQLAPGVKVSRVSGLAKDIARALSVLSVRVVEVIPGKPYIGLEIPNKERELVSLKEVLASKNFARSKSNLSLVMGKDIAGLPVVADLAKMPHVLVAGTTGSGKSVAINTMILSMLYKSTPEQVRMIMVDPKMLELSVYEGIPHLLTPVVTDMKEAANALRWSVGEMERRYKLMSKMGVRNLKGFNQLIHDAQKKGEVIRDPLFVLEEPLAEGEEFPVLSPLPQIVIIIDELADMMMVVGKKVEELIARLAQKARAAGIHLILATQRPSVDVLTGLIKANVPTRVSFQVSSRIDSRTILDQSGAEALLGNGDMLFLPSGTSIPIRAHGAFVDDHEVHKVVEFLKQTAPADYLDEITQDKSDNADGFGFSGNKSGAESDALYDEAVQFVTESRKASISSVQRKFRIGYNRAARLIEDMENAGVVSPPESNGSRVVLAQPAPAD